MTDVIYLAPLCQEHERMWFEHDAPVDCECIDGPHPWIKYVAPLHKPDPLLDIVEWLGGEWTPEEYVKEIRAALDARGFEIRKKNDG